MWYGFRGQDLPVIHIGKVDSRHEISGSKDGRLFCYEVEIASFFDELRKAEDKYRALRTEFPGVDEAQIIWLK